MQFAPFDYFHLQSSGLLEVCYYGTNFTICRVAKWAYMAVVILEDTIHDEYEDSRLKLACWHVDCNFAKEIMANNALFAATVLSNKTGREADLVTTISWLDPNELQQILSEVNSGARRSMLDPELDRIFMVQETDRLKLIVDKYGEDPKFSPKKVWVGMLLLLLYPFGLPFFYFNKPVWGGIMLASFLVCCGLPPLVIGCGILGCVLIVMLLIHLAGEKLRDKDGLLICTKKRQRVIQECVAKYKANREALEAECE